MRKYFVFNDTFETPGRDFGVVAANTPEEAKEAYVKNYVANMDERDLDYFTTMAINMCFAEKFFMYKGEHCFNMLGMLGDSEELIGEIMTQNVRRYFADRPEYGDIYLKTWDDNATLPNEIVQYIALKECMEGDYMQIDIVPFENMTIR